MDGEQSKNPDNIWNFKIGAKVEFSIEHQFEDGAHRFLICDNGEQYEMIVSNDHLFGRLIDAVGRTLSGEGEDFEILADHIQEEIAELAYHYSQGDTGLREISLSTLDMSGPEGKPRNISISNEQFLRLQKEMDHAGLLKKGLELNEKTKILTKEWALDESEVGKNYSVRSMKLADAFVEQAKNGLVVKTV